MTSELDWRWRAGAPLSRLHWYPLLAAVACLSLIAGCSDRTPCTTDLHCKEPRICVDSVCRYPGVSAGPDTFEPTDPRPDRDPNGDGATQPETAPPDVPADLPPPIIDVSATSLGFGRVEYYMVERRSIQVTNRGEGTLVLRNAEFSVVSGVFQVELPELRTLERGETVELEVTFSPAPEGDETETPFENELLLTSNDPLTPTVTIPVAGVGFVIEYCVLLRPHMLDFGSVMPGTTSLRVLEIENCEDRTVTVRRIEIVGDERFWVINPVRPVDIPSGEILQVGIGFSTDTPVRERLVASLVVYTSLEVYEVEMVLGPDTVLCLERTPVEAVFTHVRPGQQTEVEIEFRNCDTTELNLYPAEVTPDSDPGFHIVTSHTGPVEIFPFRTTRLTVAYQPLHPLREPATGELSMIVMDPLSEYHVTVPLFAYPPELSDCPIATVRGREMPAGAWDEELVRVQLGGAAQLDFSGSLDPLGDTVTPHWSLVRPEGSFARIMTLPTGFATLIPDTYGDFHIELYVTSDRTGLRSCNTDYLRVRAY